MQYARAILPSVACPALKYFSTLTHKRHDFRKKKLLNVFFILSTTFSETFVILKKIERYMIM